MVPFARGCVCKIRSIPSYLVATGLHRPDVCSLRCVYIMRISKKLCR